MAESQTQVMTGFSKGVADTAGNKLPHLLVGVSRAADYSATTTTTVSCRVAGQRCVWEKQYSNACSCWMRLATNPKAKDEQ